MNEIECARNIRKYKEEAKNLSIYDYDEKEIQRFIDTMNKAIKICEKYYSIKKKWN